MSTFPENALTALERLADPPGQIGLAIRLGQQRDAVIDPAVMDQSILGIARCVEDAKRRPALADLRPAAAAAWRRSLRRPAWAAARRPSVPGRVGVSGNSERVGLWCQCRSRQRGPAGNRVPGCARANWDAGQGRTSGPGFPRGSAVSDWRRAALAGSTAAEAAPARCRRPPAAGSRFLQRSARRRRNEISFWTGCLRVTLGRGGKGCETRRRNPIHPCPAALAVARGSFSFHRFISVK